MVKNIKFAEMIKDVVEGKLGEGYEVFLREVKKNNGTVLSGLCIQHEDENVSPTIYLEGIEEAYDNGEIGSVAECARQIIQTYHSHKMDIGTNQLDMNAILSNKEDVYGRLAPKVINAEANKELLETVPYSRFLDLAVIYQIGVKVDGAEQGWITVSNELMDRFGYTLEELHENALKNMAPAEVMSLGSAISMLIGPGADADEINQVEASSDISMTIVTNSSKFNGANNMLNTECFVELAEKNDCDLYILPSSIHEVIVVPDKNGVDVDGLKSMVYEINRSSLGPEDILSDSVYIFSRQNGQFAIA